jgi:hypothetical protein
MMRLKERPQISENLRGENRKNSAAGTMKLYASGHFDATISRAAMVMERPSSASAKRAASYATP